MGTILGIAFYPVEDVPVSFTRTDSKHLYGHLMELHWKNPNNDLVRLLKHLNLSLEPLTKIGGLEEETLESYLARDPTPAREEHWYVMHAENEATWQTPDACLEALKPLLIALDQEPDVFFTLGIDDAYFIEGFFRQDLLDLEKMLEWAKTEGKERIKLYAH